MQNIHETSNLLQQEKSPTRPPSSSGTKRNKQGKGRRVDNSPKKKRIYTKCSADGCTNIAKKGGVCVRHGAKRKTCSHEGCANVAQIGGVCFRHGAKPKTCSQEGCTNNALKGGVCWTHGAKVKTCSHEECTNVAKKGGVCNSHGAKRKTCSHEGCTTQAMNNGVCVRHGAKVKICSHEGCTKQAQKLGLCYKHRDKSKSDSGIIVIGSLEVSSTKVAASSSLDPTPVPAPVFMPSLIISSSPGEETDDEAVMKMNGNKKEAEVKGEEDTADLVTQQAVFAVAVWQNKFEELAKLAKAGGVKDEKISEIRNRFMSTGQEARNADANDESSSGTRTVPV